MNSKLSNVISDNEIQVLNGVSQEFQSLSDEEVVKRLWSLTYRPKFELEKMGLSVYPTFQEHYKKVRKEIYEQSGHYPAIKVEDTEEDNALCNALQTDKFAYWRISSVISSAVLDYSIEELKRISYLINSKNEKYNFGALRSLRLNLEEANFFMPYISAVATYFNKLFEEVMQVLSIEEEKKEECVHEEEEVTEVPTNNVRNREEDMLEKIIKNKEPILNFFRLSKSLKKDGGEELLTQLSNPEMVNNISEYIDTTKALEGENIKLDFLLGKEGIIEGMFTL